jgi:hypothetical protein
MPPINRLNWMATRGSRGGHQQEWAKARRSTFRPVKSRNLATQGKKLVQTNLQNENQPAGISVSTAAEPEINPETYLRRRLVI